MITEEQKLRKRTKRLLLVFIVLLVLSGITAFPLEWELSVLFKLSAIAPQFVNAWITKVYTAIHSTDHNYPFMSYGTDWLAFAHIVIATAFVGPLRDPVKNRWVIEWGMIACVMVFPLAFICGPIRGIPFYWQLVDCSFGIFGFIPLYICRKNILQIEKLQLK